MQIKEVIIQKISIKDPKHGEKNGREWTMYPVGVQIKDIWYNGTFWNADDLDEFKMYESGSTQLLVFFQDEYKDKDGQMKKVWKFKLPKPEIRTMLKYIDKNYQRK